MTPLLRREEYTVGWVCALSVELAAAQEMFDEEHETPQSEAHDTNIYTCGRIGEHNVVIACLPEGQMGTNSAAAVASQMRSAFTSTRFGLMVGIGGGVPSEEADIRLGDVVVSKPHEVHGGVVQYDSGKATPSGFQRTGCLNTPPTILLSAIANLRANHIRGRCKLLEYLLKLDSLPEFGRKAAGSDTLFEAKYDHKGGATCSKCSRDYLVAREPRRQEVVVHYGTIASGNQVIKDARTRDRLSSELGGILCFEMETAGLMNTFPCLVIRGVCDYADSHKNKKWQPYAAATAAAYAKEVLSVIPAAEVAKTRAVEEVTRGASKHDSQLPASPPAKRRKTDSSDGIEASIAEQQTFTLTNRPQVKSMTRAPVLRSPQEKDCLRSLSFPEQEHRYNDIHIAKDTCDWLLEDPQYRAWLENPRGLFWIKGNPGTGKSVLMKFAVKKMHERKPGKLILSFFIHGQGTDLQKTPLGIFRALLNSMLQDFPEYLAQLTAKYEDREKRFGGYMADRWKWSDRELQEFLFDVLTEGTKHLPVIIFIDALDECGEGPAKSLLAYFKDLAKQVEREEAQVKICLSSRHYPILGLDTIPAIFVEERNDIDIQWYTQERLKDIQPRVKRQLIEKEILLKARGGFQWVFLVAEMVIGRNLAGIRTDQLLEELASCPGTLSELYAATLSGVSEAEKRQMVKLFQWVLFAERPLSAQELREALATDKDMVYTTIAELRKHESWSDTLIDFERHVKHISRGLIEFQTREIWEQYELDGEDSDREAQLIHQSVADYLLDRFLNTAECNQYGLQSQIGAGHFQISRSCLRYLTLGEVLEGALLPRGTLSSKFPLAPYATRFLFEHIQKVEREGVLQPDLLSIIQWAPRSEILRQLADLWRILDPDSAHTPMGWPFFGATAFHVLAAFGSKSAFDAFLEKNDGELDGRDLDGNTPLLLAIRGGHQDIALRLLDRSIEWRLQHKEDNDRSIMEGKNICHQESRLLDVNAENNDGETALTVALMEKAGDVIFKLIEAGADLKYLGQETALVFYAVSNRNMMLLTKLIEKNVNLDGAVFFALKDLSPEQDDGLMELISELLKAGANTTKSPQFERISESEDYDEDENEDEGEIGGEDENEDESRYDDDALVLASRRGLTTVTNLLLSHGASATSRDEVGKFPLLIAIENGHEEIVQALIRKAPSAVEMKDKDGRSALNVALQNEQLELTTLLLKEGSFSTPSSVLEEFFFDATRYGAIDIVEAVLQKDSVIPDSKDSNNRTPLSWAAEGHEAIVKLLLDTGKVNVDSRDQNGRTPLSWAAQYGQERIFELLLETGNADVDYKDQNGQTLLSWAAQYGQERIFELLLETGKVNVDSKDQSGRTPLWWAVHNKYERIVKLLLETGNADVDSKDQNGQTLLSWAAQYGQERIFELLLETGKVDAESKDQNGRTPLLWVAQYGQERIFELLLETAKVNADSKDQNGRTPLSWAAQHGQERIFELLLETGKVDADSKDQNGRTPLSWAAQYGQERIFELLLETGKVDADSKDQNGQTPLLLAAANRHEAIVKLLLGTGKVNVDSKDQNGRTPLSWAAQHGQERIFELLLETGKVDADSKDQNGRIPLSWAAQYGQERIFELLLEIGKVDVDSKDKHKWTPLLLAAANEHEAIVKLLLDTGKVDVDTEDDAGRTPLLWAAENGHEAIVKLLLNTDKVNTNAKDRYGRTPLFLAVRKGHEITVKLLLDTDKVDVDTQDTYSWTPLSWSVECGHEAMVKLLLATSKIDVDRKDMHGRTPLWWTAQNGHEAIAKLLLGTGKVDVNSKDHDGRTPLFWAARSGNKAVARLLRLHNHS